MTLILASRPLHSVFMADKDKNQGLFISFEGPECAGKSTQTDLLVKKLEAEGRELCLTREPGGTTIGEELRTLVKHVQGDDAPVPEAELFMFGASRAQLMQKVILPALASGQVVICDRFADSTTAYQGYARGFDLELIAQVNAVATAGRWPDLTILMDLEPEISFQRGQLRDGSEKDDRFEDEDRQFHEKVRDGFLDIARKEPDRFLIIDADSDIDAIHEQIWERVSHALK